MPKVFDDQDLNIIQSPLVDEEKPIFNNPTLKSKSKIFEMRYHHVYDDYNDKFVDQLCQPNNKMKEESIVFHDPTLGSNPYAFKISYQPIYDDYYDDCAQDVYCPNEEVNVHVLQEYPFPQNDL